MAVTTIALPTEDWNYTSPPQSDVDWVRLLIGDTQQASAKLLDSEICSFLLLEGDKDPALMVVSSKVLYRAASRCARSIGNRFADMVSLATLEQKADYTALMRQYYLMATQLLAEHDRVGIAPRVGGQSLAGKVSQALDTDLPRPRFKRDLAFSEPGTGNEPQSTVGESPEVPW